MYRIILTQIRQPLLARGNWLWGIVSPPPEGSPRAARKPKSEPPGELVALFLGPKDDPFAPPWASTGHFLDLQTSS